MLLNCVWILQAKLWSDSTSKMLQKLAWVYWCSLFWAKSLEIWIPARIIPRALWTNLIKSAFDGTFFPFKIRLSYLSLGKVELPCEHSCLWLLSFVLLLYFRQISSVSFSLHNAQLLITRHLGLFRKIQGKEKTSMPTENWKVSEYFGIGIFAANSILSERDSLPMRVSLGKIYLCIPFLTWVCYLQRSSFFIFVLSLDYGGFVCGGQIFSHQRSFSIFCA